MRGHEWTSGDSAATVCPVRTIDTELGPLHVVNDLSSASSLWEWTRQHRGRWLGLDDETNAEDPFSRGYELRTVQVADESSGWVIQAQRPGMAEVVRTIVSEHDHWVAWFSRNDIIFTERGVPGSVRLGSYHPHVADGQVALAYYDPRTVTTGSKKDSIDPRISRPKGLKPAAALHLKFDFLSRAEERMHEKFRDLHKAGMGVVGSKDDWTKYGFKHVDIDDEDYLIYAGLDGIVAVRMWNMMLPSIVANNQWDAFQKDLRLQWHYDLMCLRGQPVDGPYVQWLDSRLSEIVEENTQLLGYYHIPPSASGASIAGAFNWLTERGYCSTPNDRTTPGGSVSWDKIALERIKMAEPQSYAGQLAINILSSRRATKFQSSYVRNKKKNGMLDSLEHDGRVHPDLRAIGTITSRNAAARPPLQQPPKREKLLKIRTALCAYPGHVLVTADLQQGEPRVMAGLSGDQNLIRDLLHGDLYSSIAGLTYGNMYLGKDQGKLAGTPSYAMRQNGKFGYLAWSYSCGPGKLAGLFEKDLDFRYTVPMAKATLSRWEAAYPDLIRFRDRANLQPAAFLESGWIAPLWDRYFVDDKGLHLSTKPSRLGLNYYTQGTQRHLFATAIHRIIDAGWSWALYWVMHDEILLSVPESMAKDAAELLKWAMTMDFHGVPIECDVDQPPYSNRWADYPEAYDLNSLVVANELDDELPELLGV